MKEAGLFIKFLSSRKTNIARSMIAVLLALSMTFYMGCKARPVRAHMPDESAAVMENGSSLPVETAPKVDSESVPTVYHNYIVGHEGELNALLDTICERYNVVGMSAAAFEKDLIVYRHSYGFANREKNLAADGTTKYRIASVSKMVTAMLALMLEETSDFDIDDDLRLHIPALNNPYYPNAPITTRQLMLHTSGFQDGKGYLDALAYKHFPPLSDVFETGGVWTGFQPGKNYVYSNFGAGLMSGAIESVTGERFFDYAKATLFDPLGVDAGYSVSLIKNKTAIASIYNGSECTASPSQWGDMPVAYAGIAIGEMYLLGQGELVISAEDLAKIGIILAGDGSYEGKIYLTPETLLQMNSIQLMDEEQNITRGLGTMAVSELLPGIQLFGHQGNAYGMISGIFYDPVSHAGVVFISNGCNSVQDAQGIYSINREIVGEIWKYL